MRCTALGLLGLVLSLPAAAADVVINEVMYNPLGADGGHEWLELYNLTAADVDLSGWRIDRATSSWSTRHVFAANTVIGAGGYLLVGESEVPDADVVVSGLLAMGNSEDAVRLVRADGTTIEDTVIYGGGSLSDYADIGDISDRDGSPISAAPAAEGASIARAPDGVDTHDQALDFQLSNPPTPGQPNPPPPLCVPDAAGVVINEFLPDPVGTDSAVLLEYVELYNPSEEWVELSGWSLERASRVDSGTSLENWSSIFVFDEGDQVGPEGFTVLGESNVALADIISSVALGMYSGGGGDGLRLLDCEGTIVDVVIYGGTNSDGLAEEGGMVAAEVAPAPSAGIALGRVPDGVDTDSSVADWRLLLESSPGAPNVECEQADGSLLLSEVLVNPEGVDREVGLEYIELYNGGPVVAGLFGWVLQSATQGDVWTDVVVFDYGTTVAPQSYFVVGEPAVLGADLSVNLLDLGNGSGGDGLRLVDCAGTVADTLVYGDSNVDGIVDSSGAVATSVAPLPPAGQALARRSHDHPTGASASDWWLPGENTPGEPNPTPPFCEPSQGGLVLNEVLVNPGGSDAAALAEYIEIYNDSSAPIELDGWTLSFASSLDTYKEIYRFEPGARIEAGAFVVVGEHNVPAADITVARLGLGNGTGGDGIRISDCEGTVVDTLVYGGENTDGVVDDTGVAAVTFAAKPGDDEALARRVDGVDTDDHAADWFITTQATPGASNPAPPVCVPGDHTVVINELLPNPLGADSTALGEWIELSNPSNAAVDVSNWSLEFASRGGNWRQVATVPQPAVLAAGGYLVIGEQNSGAEVLVEQMSLGNGSGGDGVRLVDCSGGVQDTVVYGGVNDDGIPDDTGVARPLAAPLPAEAQAIARRIDGLDTDDSQADFVAAMVPTPGQSNPELRCVPSDGSVVLNELFPDPEGDDTTAQAEWVELFNRGDRAAVLDGWSLNFASRPSDRSIDFTFPSDTSVGAGDWFVVGAEQAPVTDLTANLDIGNGRGGDAAILLDCTGQVVDVLVYGGENSEGHLDESGRLAEPAAKPAAGFSLARVVDGVDTDHPDDWRLVRPATPGAANEVAPGDSGGRDTARPDSERDSGVVEGCGCATSSTGGSGAWLMLTALLALRRRR